MMAADNYFQIVGKERKVLLFDVKKDTSKLTRFEIVSYINALVHWNQAQMDYSRLQVESKSHIEVRVNTEKKGEQVPAATLSPCPTSSSVELESKPLYNPEHVSVERNFDTDPTILFLLLHNQMWAEVEEYVENHRQESKTWIYRLQRSILYGHDLREEVGEGPD